MEPGKEQANGRGATDPNDKNRRIFKIIVIGDSNVGKTCLTYRFCGGEFPEKTEATIGVDFREKNVTIEGETVKLQLWDTAGQERFRKSMVQHYYRNVHAVIFVYDVTKMSTFESLPTWIDECDRHSLSPDTPRVLVGNKCDMADRKVVTSGIAQKFSDANNMPFFETAAKLEEEGDKINNVFMTLAHKLRDHKSMMPPPFDEADSRDSRGKSIKLRPNKAELDGDDDQPSDSSCAC
eukprot:XP_001178826.1 PREDICTED: putative Ras-related protein Rab-33 isoform X1 [Strongylocentrotus purpuratus]